MANSKGRRARFGNVRKLPSGRWQARYTGPDGVTHKAPLTFDTQGDAETWLSTVRSDIVRETWSPAKNAPKPVTFGEYAEGWVTSRKVRGRPLADRTQAHYRMLLDRLLLPTFGRLPLTAITAETVNHWYDTTAQNTPTLRSHAYSLLRSILTTAADPSQGRALIPYNPASIRGAGSTPRAKKIKPASLAELETLVAAMPDRYKVMTLLAAWCALRFGELAELRRSDLNTKTGVLHVRRGVVRAGGKPVVKPPKSEAGIRDVTIPPHLLPLVREHVLAYAEPGKDGLLFPAAGGGHLAPSSLYRVFYRARDAAGRPDLRWHDLRHSGAVLAAQTGATLAELMARLGHSTPAAAMRYQHMAQGRDAEIAAALSRMVIES